MWTSCRWRPARSHLVLRTLALRSLLGRSSTLFRLWFLHVLVAIIIDGRYISHLLGEVLPASVIVLILLEVSWEIMRVGMRPPHLFLLGSSLLGSGLLLGSRLGSSLLLWLLFLVSRSLIVSSCFLLVVHEVRMRTLEGKLVLWHEISSWAFLAVRLPGRRPLRPSTNGKFIGTKRNVVERMHIPSYGISSWASLPLLRRRPLPLQLSVHNEVSAGRPDTHKGISTFLLERALFGFSSPSAAAAFLVPPAFLPLGLVSSSPSSSSPCGFLADSGISSGATLPSSQALSTFALSSGLRSSYPSRSEGFSAEAFTLERILGVTHPQCLH